MAIRTRTVSANELESLAPTLVALLRDSVDGGASLGFLPPLKPDDAWAYWLSLRPELAAGSRQLLAAYVDDRIVGCGQLAFPAWTTARHRAELQKLFVASGLRGRGVGRSLVVALHEAARLRGRSLLLLNTRSGEPLEDFYKGLGYKPVGVIPGYSVGPEGERYDTTLFCQELAP
jgi:GNAT superfamily N-acetyltransferase